MSDDKKQAAIEKIRRLIWHGSIEYTYNDWNKEEKAQYLSRQKMLAHRIAHLQEDPSPAYCTEYGCGKYGWVKATKYLPKLPSIAED